MDRIGPDRGSTGEPDEVLAELLRSTGRRPPVSAERTARVRTAVRERWRGEVLRRRRRTRVRRSLAAAAAVAVAAVTGWGVYRGGILGPHGETVLVERVWGAGGADPATGARALHPGDAVARGAELQTGDAGRIAVRMPSGHSLRLDTDTRVRIVGASAVALERGAVYVDSHGSAGHASGSMAVDTPFGVVRTIGTQFEARIGAAALVVRVRDGRVTLGAEPAREVDAGFELEIGRDGRTVRRSVAPSAPVWDWVGAVAPMMDIDGRTLADFLAWLARERGLAVRYDGPGIEGRAASIRLNGSIEGLSLDEALASVVATCGVDAGIEDGALVVHSPA